VLDDLMVSNQGDHLMLVVNAARKAADQAHLREHLSETCVIEVAADCALVALQGPRAEAALASFAPDVRTMRFMDVRALSLLGDSCLISRSGYTGEDGFEISVRADRAEALCVALLKDENVAPVGLGARDSLRLEAGLCLYGSDLDPGTTPVEAALEWAIQKSRRSGGERAGGFPGADMISRQLTLGPPRRRVGLAPEGRAPVRGGTPIYRAEDNTAPIGIVTSGGYGVSLGAPIAMGYVPTISASPGTRLFAEVRGKRLSMRVCELPFIALGYRRP
jgi:aminomethyltransferase